MASRHQPQHREARPAAASRHHGVPATLALTVVTCTLLLAGCLDYATSLALSPPVVGTTIDAQSPPHPDVHHAPPSEAAAAGAGRSAGGPVGASLVDMSPADLRSHAAQLQARFTARTMAWRDAETLAEEADDKALRAEQESERLARRREEAAEAYVDMVNEHLLVGPGADPLVAAVLRGPGTIRDVIADTTLAELLLDSQAAEYEDLDSLSAQAELVSRRAGRARAHAERAAAEAERLLAAMQAEASRAAVAANQAVLAQAREGVVADPAQDRRNQRALAAWSRYLRSLEAAGVVPPDAASIATPTPTSMPYGLRPVLGADGTPVPGVARTAVRTGNRTRTLRVLPRQTVAAVSKAFSLIGRPYADGAAGPDRFGCAGLAAAAWRAARPGLPASVGGLRAATPSVDPDTVQVGDLVFFGESGTGLHHTGIALGDDRMLTADADTYQVGVQEFPSAPAAVTRPALGASGGAATARGGTGTGDVLQCGASPPAPAAPGLRMPLREGTFTFSAGFGERGSWWSSGHTGLDFAAPAGTAVYAASSGRASLVEVDWAGTLLTIDHGDGVHTRYAHMSTVLVDDGEAVEAGQLVGGVGSRGNSTAPHLHFEVLVAGAPVDPLPHLLGDGGAVGGWGGHSNGLIPLSALCAPRSAPLHRLRCDAAAALDALDGAYRARFGSPVCLTDSYRSYAAQVETFKRKPTLAAVPGTSNHGWGVAVDLCGGIESATSPQHGWMRVHAPRYGWRLPEWAREQGSRPEPWHWEFDPGS